MSSSLQIKGHSLEFSFEIVNAFSSLIKTDAWTEGQPWHSHFREFECLLHSEGSVNVDLSTCDSKLSPSNHLKKAMCLLLLWVQGEGWRPYYSVRIWWRECLHVKIQFLFSHDGRVDGVSAGNGYRWVFFYPVGNLSSLCPCDWRMIDMCHVMSGWMHVPHITIGWRSCCHVMEGWMTCLQPWRGELCHLKCWNFECGVIIE